MTVAWIDAGNGCAGDMLLAALVDAGADFDGVRAGLARLRVDDVRLTEQVVRRHGLRARHVVVEAPETRHARHLPEILDVIRSAALPAAAERFATKVFDTLADAEAAVHGIERDRVHFHEVGALDAIVDIVGCGLGLAALGLLDATVTVSPIAVGGGTVTAAHGRLTVPPPAVLALLTGAGAPIAAHPAARELCTPTGAALLVTLADAYGPMPACVPVKVGVGAGTADPPGHANVVRVVVGSAAEPDRTWVRARMTVVETTVDDLDPRLWPEVLTALRGAGAADAWCAPVTAPKGRPGMVLTALAADDRVDGVCAAVFAHTSTLGVRLSPVERRSLPRDRVTVDYRGRAVSVKRGFLNGVVVTAQPEYEEAKAAAEATGQPLRRVLDEVRAAAGT
ncbi:nickel pincer cofactor biosynthesis protein LarC [Amycolatopsis sp. NBC_01488]|uniref:nickel pincer cofactor biosynthesis protein LarC n=1 Tax=Amycolatopsis sp. NBC_01488 TaxID=2903563 RepID=UPI002E2BC4FF|nr:nickel pincer cofactor biosynthesis protein LarC [Amycolatopsis sp. NBC_01488]